VTPPFSVEPLGEEHDRAAFSCGEEALDRYFKTQVTQDTRRRVSNCFVAVESDTCAVAGFYTMASASIPTPDLPAGVTKKLPRYPTLPAVRIGRLAVDVRFRGRGLGGALLADATVRALTAAAASSALLVDAKNDVAVAFYEHHKFERFTSQPRTLFLPLATAEKLLAGQGGRKKKS
jgi:ribosomal protein S18 acetylase RimI-like enzyme